MDLDEMKRRLIRDIKKLRSPPGYLNAGYPRYNTLFGRDSLISAWQMLKVDPGIAQATLHTLAQYQGKAVNTKAEEEPGKILHEIVYDRKKQAELPYWDFPYYGSVDSTPLFILLAGEYYRRTHKTHASNSLSNIWNNIAAAFEWIRDYGDYDADSFVEYERKNPYGLLHQGWKDGVTDHLQIKPPVAIVEVQGYVYAAYQNLIFLSRKLGKNGIATEAWTRSKTLKKKFNQDFWMEEESYFALALDGEKRQKRVITSNPGHLLVTGILTYNRIKPLVSRLFQPDLWTAYGIRTLSAKDPNFDPCSYHTGSVWPHDNWIIYKGLQSLGFHLHAHRIKQALIHAFRELGKAHELYGVIKNRIVDLSQNSEIAANPLQAWSSAGLLEMIWDD